MGNFYTNEDEGVTVNQELADATYEIIKKPKWGRIAIISISVLTLLVAKILGVW